MVNKRYWMFVKRYMLFPSKKNFVGILFIVVVQCILNLLIPQFYKEIIDNAMEQKSIQVFILLVSLMAFSFILVSVLSVLKDYLLSKMAETLAVRLRNKINKKISLVKYGALEKYDLSEIIARYNKEIDVIKGNIGNCFVKLFSNVISLFLAGIMIVLYDWKILLATVLIICIYINMNKFWGRKLKKYSQKIMKYNVEAVECISESYKNVITTRMYGLYEYVTKRFEDAYNKQYRAQVFYDLSCSANLNIGVLLIQLLGCVVWAIGGYSVFIGKSTLGSITALLNYQSMLLSPINFLCQFNNGYQATINAIERIEEIFALPDEELDKCLEVPQPIKKISIRNLCFSYEGGKSILNNVNLEFHSNNITAIMGLSGCGKTTLIKVLLGFYSFNEGKIKFNDVDMDTSGLICARKKIAYVEQETCFFKGTLIDNLIISGVDDKGKFIEIAKEFDLYDEIVQMPDMMNTQLASGATNLSVGQRKRLDFMRAFATEKEIIIMDEPTAALDSDRRKRLYNYLQSIKKNKIIIVITHNTEENDYFDKIIYLDKK